MSSSALIAAIPALSAALLLICFPKFFLVALFGASYADAATALVWLTLAQCVLTLTGPTGSLLLMTGHTWGLLVIHVLSASLMIAVALLTLPSLGYLGIVYAAVAMLATQNIASWLLARWTNGVWTQVSMASIRRPWLTERRG